MKVLGIGWIGLKVADRSGAEDFLAGTLGFEKVRGSEKRDFSSFRLPSGQAIELFGPQSSEYGLHDAPVVAGFEVDDVEAFRQEMTEQGVEFVTGVEGGPKFGQWCYFRGPEGLLFQVFSHGQSA
jgi:catechol 2,3-dioxygenase-like lactoylglutathione lyase family enzyme